jgi:Spy/CpxP family protein refolding chaperone
MKKLPAFIFTMAFLMGLFAVSDAAMCGKGMDEKSMMGGGTGMMGDGMGMDREHYMMRKMMSLGLDEKQMEEIKAIHLNSRKEAIRKKADLEIAEIELREIMAQDPVDLRAAEAKVKQIEALKVGMKMEHIKTMEEIKGKLTPEQKKKFHSMMTAHMGGMDMMGGGMGMMMGGKCGKCGMMRGMGQGDEDPESPADMPASPEADHHH